MDINALTVTGAELGEVLNITDRRVRQLAEIDVFRRVERGRYPLVACVQAYMAAVEKDDTDELRQEKIGLLKQQRRRLELDNEDRIASGRDLDFQNAVVGVLVTYWHLHHRMVATWLYGELFGRGDKDAREIAGLVENWLIACRAEIESDLRKAVDAARTRKVIIKDFDVLHRLLGKGRDPYQNDDNEAAP